MRSHIDESLYLVSEDGEDVCLMENTGKSLEGRSLPKYALQIAQHAIRLESVLRLASELERLAVSISYDTIDTEHESTDSFVIRSPKGYFGIINGERIDEDIPTATDTARLAYGLPSALSDRVVETLRVEDSPPHKGTP